MMALLALCAAVVTATGARSAASVVPARVDAALLLDGAQAAPGLRPFLDGVAQRAPALAPASHLAAAVGPDLFTNPASWGLARGGPRAIVLANGAFALTAPVRDARAARAGLDAWLREAGAVRQRAIAGHTAFTSGEGRRIRVGLIASVAGTVRLVTASGADAAALAFALAQIGAKSAATPPLSSDRGLREAIAQLNAPAGLVLRGSEPVRGAALRLAGSADGLVATGLVLARAPLVSGNAPDASACAEGALLCVRAALGPAGREVFALAARAYLAAVLPAQEREASSRIAARAAAVAERLVARSDGADARLLVDSATPLPALRLWAVSSPAVDASVDAAGARPACIRSDATRTWFATPCAETVPADVSAKQGEPALDATLDLAAADAVLQKLTPLDVIQGGLAAGLYAGRLTAGGLLRRSGPVRLRGTPHPAGAQVELRWPLH
jgi:hypothetical protein